MSKKIILFGGTFDPIHCGHVIVAEYSASQICADEVVFVPAKRSPHKEVFPVASGEDRLEMIRIAISCKDKFRLSDCELNRCDPSYTLDTVRSFRTEYGKTAEFFLLIGADMVKDIDNWYRIEELVDECTLCVMQRGGQKSPDFAKVSGLGGERIEKLNRNVISTPLTDISSTEIRSRIACGFDTGDMLDVGVADYIRKKALYTL